MIRRVLVQAIVLSLLPGLVAGCATSQRAVTESISPVVGTWKLLSAESRFADGKVEPRFGADPSGILIYDTSGRMSVHLMRRDRLPFASANAFEATPEELKTAFDSYFSYYGTYVVDAAKGTIWHEVVGCSYPNWTGTTQKRFFEIDGNRLRLSTPPIVTDGREARVFLLWERLN